MLFQNSGQRSHTSIPAIEKTHVPILPRPIFRSITLFSWTSSPVRGSSSRFFLLHVKPSCLIGTMTCTVLIRTLLSVVDRRGRGKKVSALADALRSKSIVAGAGPEIPENPINSYPIS